MDIDAKHESLKFAIVYNGEYNVPEFLLQYYDPEEYGAYNEIALSLKPKHLEIIANALKRLKKTRNKKRVYKIDFDDLPTYKRFDEREGKYYKYSKIPDKKIISIRRVKSKYD